MCDSFLSKLHADLSSLTLPEGFVLDPIKSGDNCAVIHFKNKKGNLNGEVMLGELSVQRSRQKNLERRCPEIKAIPVDPFGILCIASMDYLQDLTVVFSEKAFTEVSQLPAFFEECQKEIDK